jgi:hypothetical protein
MRTCSWRGARSFLHALVLIPIVGVQSNDVAVGGLAVDTAGRPVTGIDVVLHRYSMATGGALLGSVTTDSTGRFVLRATEALDTSAIYFAAARVEGELYIGPFVRAPGDDAYEIVIGGEPFALGDPSGVPLTDDATVATPPRARNWSAPLLPAAALLALAGWMLVHANRPLRRRRLLVRLATIDEELAEVGQDPQRGRERERLLDRLLSD